MLRTLLARTFNGGAILGSTYHNLVEPDSVHYVTEDAFERTLQSPRNNLFHIEINDSIWIG